MRQALRVLACLSCAAGLILSAGHGTASAQTSSQPKTSAQGETTTVARGDEYSRTLESITNALSKADKTAQSTISRDEDLAKLRTMVEAIVTRIGDLKAQIAPHLKSINAQIEKLGKPPKEGAPPEPETVAAERKRLSAIATKTDGAYRRSELLQERARQLIAKIQARRGALFTEKLLQRTPSPLRPDVWHDAIVHSASSFGTLADIAQDWWERAIKRLGVIAAILAAAGAAWFALRRVVVQLAAWRRAYTAASASMQAQLASVAWLIPARAAPGTAAALLTAIGFVALEIAPPPTDQIAQALLLGFLLNVIVRALARTLLEPRASAHRPLPLATSSAKTLYILVQALAIVYALDVVVGAINRAIFAPLPLTILGSFVAAVATAGLLLAIVRTPFLPPEPSPTQEPPGDEAADERIATPADGRTTLLAPRLLKIPLLVVALAVITSSILGYVALGRFLAEQVVVTGAILVLALLAHLSIRALTRELAEEERPLAKGLSNRFDLTTPRRGQIAFVLAVVLNILLLLIVVPLLLLQWGFTWGEIRAWLYGAVFGFQVGTVRISLAHIFIAIGLFSALLALTRMLQRSLGETLLNPARMDAGIAHSIRTGVGYLGIIIAGLVAVAYVGLDITNLAIVAGALSVGIGFGLQSIVNNFVSGLILLVERPIKVGDWIVVGSSEGTVRRISVRATEIETFDRASVIVPNSELITGRVLNWTHKTSIGRVVVNVGISYDSDPKIAQDLLLKIANENPLVLTHPEPWVAFEDLGSSSLDLSLRAYIADIRRSLRVKTELRNAIVSEFRLAGLEIPYPQQDIHLRDLDAVKTAFSRAAAAREGEKPS